MNFKNSRIKENKLWKRLRIKKLNKNYKILFKSNFNLIFLKILINKKFLNLILIKNKYF